MAQIVDPRCLIGDFVIPNVSVSFAGKEDDVGVGIVEREHDTGGAVYGVRVKWMAEVVLVPNGILSVGMSREAGREEAARRAEECHFARFRALMAEAFLETDEVNLFLTWDRCVRTDLMSPLLGSMILNFLSLQVVARRLPSLFNDML